jgi:hypothetical protein
MEYLPMRISFESQGFIPNAVFCKLHTNENCESGYFYHLNMFFLYNFYDLPEQDPSKRDWTFSEIRQRYSNCPEICGYETCESGDCYDKYYAFLHQTGKVFVTYHNMIWECLAYEEITNTGLLAHLGAKNLRDHVSMRLDPDAKPEGCHAEISFFDGIRIIYFFGTSPLQCVLSMPYYGPAQFTEKEFEYFSKFLDLHEFRNPAYRLFGALDILALCSVQ